MNKLLLILLTILMASCSTVDINSPSKTIFIEGSTISDIVDKYGPPFSLVDKEPQVTMIYYIRKSKSSNMVWVPIVNLVAAGNSHRVERYVLKFDSSDRLVNQTTESVKGFTSLYTMGQNEGMLGNGGMRDEIEFRNLGKFLAKRGIFFDQRLWKLQNVSNNYFQKYKD
ncbi:hypothetical protein N9I73_04495 [Porticoccaceae bacterium]|jgi:hypothetical protein|nr:hypothetical protein [Porticoccaceae bacterium]MDA9014823.1 hypothetical protein [Porticoccaceae bacterium]